MKIESLASISAIVRDARSAHDLFGNVLNLSFEGGEGDYIFTEKLPGVKHFGLWPLGEAATVCFGADEWPADIPVPHASMEFEVGSPQEVAAAAQELQARGYEVLHDSKKEPWGQTVARLLTQDGLLIGVSYTPWFHD